MRTAILLFSQILSVWNASRQCITTDTSISLSKGVWTVHKKMRGQRKGRQTETKEREKQKVKKGAQLRTTPRDGDFLRQLDWRGELQRNTGGRVEGYRIQILDEGGNGRRSCSGRPCYVICHVVHVSFPFHFQSLGRVQEPETPDLSRGWREQRRTHLPPPTVLSLSVNQMLRRDKLGEHPR